MFVNINVHLNGGASGKDKLIRTQQFNHLKAQEFWKQSYPVILGGDFNTDIEEVQENLGETLKNELKYIHTKETKYNTENRVQRRERDGWSGVQVIMRTIDAIFYRGFN